LYDFVKKGYGLGYAAESIEKSALCVKAFGRLKSLIDEFSKLCDIIIERLLTDWGAGGLLRKTKLA